MFKKKIKFKLGSRKTLVKDLLIVDGVSRSGKFVLGNILTAFRGVEPIQYHGPLEFLPFLESFGFLDKRAAQELIRQEIDICVYDALIGRNLNHRRGDLSSIFNHPLYKKYLKRVDQPDGDSALKMFKKEKPYNLFITHELLSTIKIYFETFPGLKAVCLRRSPMSLVYEWMKRGYGNRYGTDPKFFSITLQSKNGLVPWFVADWMDEFGTLSETDRIIKAILTLHSAYDKSYRNLSPGYKKKMLIITFEDILFNTNFAVKEIGNFLKRSTVPGMKGVFKRLVLPRPAHAAYQRKTVEEIKCTASPKYFKLLLAAEKAYRSKFNSPIPYNL